MNQKAMISAAIAVVVLVAFGYLVWQFAPKREFPGWWIVLVVALVVGVGLVFVMRRGSSRSGR
jgi:protein-S-isoprenylcysteine O-methyltransferase Ste14